MRSLMLVRHASRVVARSLVFSSTRAISAPSALRLAAPRLMTVRNFASTKSAYSAVTPELTAALAGEIEAEKELERDNLGGANAPQFPNFQITTNEAEVRLTKKHGNESILVVFNVNHSVDMEEDIEGETQDTAPVPVAMPPFTVEITKGKERLCFHLDLVETGDEHGQYDFRVDEFYVAPAVQGNDEDVPATVYASSGKYIDPNLHELLFVRYLEERGIDAEFCQRIVEFATHYEHSQYVNLLHRIKAFVSK